VTGRRRAHLVLHSERTEENGSGVKLPDSLDERIGVVRMVAVDQHGTGRVFRIALSTLSNLSTNFGWKPWSSTIKPSNAATTSSRARIRTLRTQVGQEES
jgi:hypothetical protein